MQRRTQCVRSSIFALFRNEIEAHPKMMNRTIAGCIGVTAACWLAASANAAVIDSFSSVDVGGDGQPFRPVTLHKVSTVNIVEGDLTGVLGGVRKSTVSLTSVAVAG